MNRTFPRCLGDHFTFQKKRKASPTTCRFAQEAVEGRRKARLHVDLQRVDLDSFDQSVRRGGKWWRDGQVLATCRLGDGFKQHVAMAMAMCAGDSPNVPSKQVQAVSVMFNPQVRESNTQSRGSEWNAPLLRTWDLWRAWL